MLKIRRGDKGFTLIELLVVVAIIIILAMILMSAFLKAQAKAKQAACLAHGRQLGMATLMYVADYDETFPLPVYAPWGAVFTHTIYEPGNRQVSTYTVGGYRYFPPFSVYIKNEDIWICPAARWVYGERYALGYLTNWAYRVWSYASDFAGYDAAVASRTTSIIEKEFKHPLSDKFCWSCYSMQSHGNQWDDAFMGLPYLAHGEGTIYVFCDGHAEWRKIGPQVSPSGTPISTKGRFYPEGYPTNARLPGSTLP